MSEILSGCAVRAEIQRDAVKADALAELDRLRRMYNEQMERCLSAGFITSGQLVLPAKVKK